MHGKGSARRRRESQASQRGVGAATQRAGLQAVHARGHLRVQRRHGGQVLRQEREGAAGARDDVRALDV